MSFPNIPNITPTISLSRNDVISLLLSSIALEELGLAHLINAEAEKIQAVVGTLPGVTISQVTISDLLMIDDSVQNTLKDTIKKEMLLEFKLEDILRIPPGPQTRVFENTAVVRGFYGSTEVSDSSTAFYHRIVA